MSKKKQKRLEVVYKSGRKEIRYLNLNKDGRFTKVSESILNDYKNFPTVASVNLIDL